MNDPKGAYLQMFFIAGVVDKNDLLEIFGRTLVQHTPDGTNEGRPKKWIVTVMCIFVTKNDS